MYLTEYKIIGVIIVGVGIPQINIERDIIKEPLNEDNKKDLIMLVFIQEWQKCFKLWAYVSELIRTEE